MKKKDFLLLFAAFAFTLGSCGTKDDGPVSNPFDDTSENSIVRNKIVVISDLHLGNDLSYSEDVKHLKRLEQFLNEVRSSSTIKELVIAGDMLDEWYIPTRTDTYNGGTQADFVKKTVSANQSIFDVLNGIIADKKIKLTYIPGNHDMGITPENIDLAMPGVNQARDSNTKYSVGTYHPDGYPEIAIEHGHRYDFFCAMTPNANETDAPGSIMPPGYFFARIAADSFTDPTTPDAATKVPKVTLKDSTDEAQFNKNIYYQVWDKVMSEQVYVKDNFDDKIIKTNIGGYTKTYAINDILPHNNADGTIQMNLYNGLFTQNNWSEIEKYNNVTVITDIKEAIVGSLQTAYIDNQAYLQYFRIPTSVRLVVFGHTHIPMLKSYTSVGNEGCVYANTGTWEDQKSRDKNAVIDQDTAKMNFVVIAPIKSDAKKLQVSLYKYLRGKHSLVDNKEVDL